jgi:hypothetical protein
MAVNAATVKASQDKALEFMMHISGPVVRTLCCSTTASLACCLPSFSIDTMFMGWWHWLHNTTLVIVMAWVAMPACYNACGCDDLGMSKSHVVLVCFQ